MAETILQHPILTDFVYPFLIVFFVLFAVLEKTNLLGKDKKQINALLSFVIGLIFVSAVFPKQVLGNMMLFLSLALVIMLVVMLLWGFIFAKDDGGVNFTSGMKIGLAVVVAIATVIGILWAFGIQGRVYDILFNQSWSETFWTNFFFIILIGVALALVIQGKK